MTPTVTKDDAIAAARNVALAHGAELGLLRIADFVDENHPLASLKRPRIGHWFLYFSPKGGPGLDTEICIWVDGNTGQVTLPDHIIPRRSLLARLFDRILKRP